MTTNSGKAPRAPDSRPVAGKEERKSEFDMSDTLSKVEQIALHGASDALVLIRSLASAPITPESQKAIRDLADAFHNVPAHCAGPKQQREANAFLVDAALRNATKTCLEHGFTFMPALAAA